MNKEHIAANLQTAHRDFITWFSNMSESDFLKAPPDKWTPGQHLEHIRRSVAAVNLALGLPRFVLRLLIGKANRPSRDFDGLVNKYKTRLMEGGRAGGRFIPPPVPANQSVRIQEKLAGDVAAICKKLSGWSEKELDHYILPHPLLGKLTIREMMYFTIYHVSHHLELLRKPPYASPSMS